ncbi:MAG: gamma-glutamylcyclotransferase [Candidatus Binatia bacterium]
MVTTVNLFVYGTLLSEEIRYAVLQKHFSTCEAELSGFKRIIPAQGYPYIIPHPHACVRGLLIRNLDALAVAQLDEYEEEGILYYRRSVTVMVDVNSVPSEVYVGNVSALTQQFGLAIMAPGVKDS